MQVGVVREINVVREASTTNKKNQKRIIPADISNSTGIGALEKIEELIFGRNRSEARTTGIQNLRQKTKNPSPFEEKPLVYANYNVRELTEIEREIIQKEFVILQRYFEQRADFLAANWRIEKQAMRIKMVLLIVRTKVLGEFFLPG